MANTCRAEVQACAIRVAELDGAGVPQPGANNMYTSSALVTMGITAEIASGEEVELKNACGEVCVSYKDCDRLKRLTVDLTLCLPDPELQEMLVGGTVLTSGAATGYAFPALNSSTCSTGRSIEVWTKRITSAGAPDPVYPYEWWVFPRVYLQHNSRTFENGPQQPTFTGFAIENENWFNGPLNNWPVASTRVAQSIPTALLPTPTCGYATIVAS